MSQLWYCCKFFSVNLIWTLDDMLNCVDSMELQKEAHGPAVWQIVSIYGSKKKKKKKLKNIRRILI
jgi:hypothetical protein